MDVSYGGLRTRAQFEITTVANQMQAYSGFFLDNWYNTANTWSSMFYTAVHYPGDSIWRLDSIKLAVKSSKVP